MVKRKDVYYYLLKAFENLGYKVNDKYQEAMQPGECVIVIDHMDFEQITTMDYEAMIYYKIILVMEDPSELPYEIVRIIGNTQDYIEKSGAPDCTSFKYGQPYTDNNHFGNTIRVEIPADIRTIIQIYKET